MAERRSDQLLSALVRLDARLDLAAAAVGLAPRPGAGPVPVTWVASEDLLAVEPLAHLAEAFGLGAFDLEVVVIALAPEIDLGYERLYGVLQADAMRRPPTVDLVLTLLCSSTEERLARRERFAAGAPLVRHGVVALVDEPGGRSPLLAHTIQLDEGVLRTLLGATDLDPRLEAVCRLMPIGGRLADVPLQDGVADALALLLRRAPGRMTFVGPKGSGRRRAASAFAAELGRPCLACALHGIADPGAVAAVVLREARLRGAVVYVEGIEPDDLPDALENDPLVILGAEDAQGGNPDAACVRFDPPDHRARRQAWTTAASDLGIRVSDDHLDLLAARFRLGLGEIDEAAGAGRARARLRGPRARIGLDDLLMGARERSRRDLSGLATQLQPGRSWGDLVLPDEAMAQLRELCDRVALRHTVMEDWGFGRRLSLGTGTAALFAGGSGTGKTLAAEVLATEIGLDLCRIDLATVVSKYIGETEKNLARLFGVAERSNAILFFDEAEALFGKRSEVRDAHDRYANIETAYLLQRMEAYDGLAILATNLRENLDDAFLRRLTTTVNFPFPDEQARRRIWGSVWPAETPIGADLDLDELAARFPITGSAIRNAALSAAYLAAAAGTAVSMEHVLAGVRREFQKLGCAPPAKSHPFVPVATANGRLA